MNISEIIEEFEKKFNPDYLAIYGGQEHVHHDVQDFLRKSFENLLQEKIGDLEADKYVEANSSEALYYNKGIDRAIKKLKEART